MKTKNRINRTSIVLLIFSLLAISMAAPPPPDMWANTGAKGEVTCYSCHSQYPLNDTGGYLQITTTPPITNGLYIPGQHYIIDEIFTRPPVVAYQCSTEIIDSTGANAGTMLVTDSTNTSLITANSGRICLWAGYYDTAMLIHCTFAWNAPMTGVVSMYSAGVARSFQIGGSGGWVSTDSLVNLHPANNTGLSNLSNETIELFPNPAKDRLNIKTTGDEKILRYSIFNSRGQEIKTGHLINATIDINNLPTGMYWLQCFTGDNKMQSAKFIKR